MMSVKDKIPELMWFNFILRECIWDNIRDIIIYKDIRYIVIKKKTREIILLKVKTREIISFKEKLWEII